MTANLSRKGRLLKLNLEQALLRCRLSISLSPQNPYGQPDSQKVLEEALITARRQTQTPILVCLFGIALAFKTGDIAYESTKPDHVAAQFLYDYFVDEPRALNYVCDVPVSMITRTRKYHQAILDARPPPTPEPLPSPTLPIVVKFEEDYQFGASGRVSIGSGELWHPADEVPYFDDYSPPPEPEDYEPPSSSPPQSPPYDFDSDAFSIWMERWIESDDQPQAKRARTASYQA